MASVNGKVCIGEGYMNAIKGIAMAAKVTCPKTCPSQVSVIFPASPLSCTFVENHLVCTTYLHEIACCNDRFEASSRSRGVESKFEAGTLER